MSMCAKPHWKRGRCGPWMPFQLSLDSPMGANSPLARQRLWLGWLPASALPRSPARCS